MAMRAPLLGDACMQCLATGAACAPALAHARRSSHEREECARACAFSVAFKRARASTRFEKHNGRHFSCPANLKQKKPRANCHARVRRSCTHCSGRVTDLVWGADLAGASRPFLGGAAGARQLHGRRHGCAPPPGQPAVGWQLEPGARGRPLCSGRICNRPDLWRLAASASPMPPPWMRAAAGGTAGAARSSRVLGVQKRGAEAAAAAGQLRTSSQL